jgi:hypothetical protein
MELFPAIYFSLCGILVVLWFVRLYCLIRWFQADRQAGQTENFAARDRDEESNLPPSREERAVGCDGASCKVS